MRATGTGIGIQAKGKGEGEFERYYRLYNLFSELQREYLNALCDIQYWVGDSISFGCTQAAKAVYTAICDGDLQKDFGVDELKRFVEANNIPNKGNLNERVQALKEVEHIHKKKNRHRAFLRHLRKLTNERITQCTEKQRTS